MAKSTRPPKAAASSAKSTRPTRASPKDEADPRAGANRSSVRKDRSRTPTPAPTTATATGTPARDPQPAPCLVIDDSPTSTELGLKSPRLDEIDSPSVFKEERDRWTNHLLTHNFDDLEEKKAAMERWKTQLNQLHIEWPIQMKIKEEKIDEQDGQGLPMPEGLPEGVNASMAEEDKAAHEKLMTPRGAPATDNGDTLDMKVGESLGSPGKRKRPDEGPAEAPHGDHEPYPPVPPPMGDTQVFNGAARFDMTADDMEEEIKTPRNPDEEKEEAPKKDVPLSAELLGTMFAQLSAQINNLGDNLNTKITVSDLDVKKLSDKIDAQKNDIHDMVADMIGDAAAASVTIASDTQKVINALASRLDVLEKKKKKNEAPAPSVPAAATPAAARARLSASPPQKQSVTPPLVDPLLRRDPWSGWKEREPARSPLRGPERSPAAAATSYDFDALKDFKPTARWTPRQVEVKGWCRFKETDRGLNRDEAKALGMQILLALPNDIKPMLSEKDIFAPYLVNRQVNFRVQDHNDIPFVQRAIQPYIKMNNIKVKGRDIDLLHPGTIP